MSDAGIRWSPETVAYLAQAGWKDGHDATELSKVWRSQLAPGFESFPAADRAMARFGGIDVRVRGPGKNCARTSFRLDPAEAWGEDERFERFAAWGTMFPLGVAGDGHAFIAIASDGRVYLIMEEIEFIGDSIEDAIENLVMGIRPDTLVD